MKNNFINQNKTYIIAEIGNNHEGDFEVAMAMIDAAKKAGANAVKFQTINPEKFITSTDTKRIAQLKKFELSNEKLIALSKKAADLKIDFFSTPFDIDSAKFLNNLQKIFKVASGDNNFFELINKIFDFKKPTIISTGLADFALLDQIYDKWNNLGKSFPLSFLHCVASYPVPPSQANLRAISSLKNRYKDAIIGYSDHTIGINSCCTAVALGAQIIEKHFTLDKNSSDFRDHQLSADPKDMKELINNIRNIEYSLGNGVKKEQECEKEIKVNLRRSIAALKDIPDNTKITEDDLICLRPGNGIPPGKENLLIGKVTSKKIKKGEIINLNMFKK